MVLAAGTRLGPYEIQSALGAGGMGEVYKARDTRLDRIVAVKILSPAIAADPQFRERFDREARTMYSWVSLLSSLGPGAPIERIRRLGVPTPETFAVENCPR